MNKCPQCGAILKTLTRICEACGSEIPSVASETAQSASGSSPLPSASKVCANIQDDLASLATRPPASRLAAFLTGLITLPTLGLGYLAVKVAGVFGAHGKSPARAKLGLEQNFRVAESSYKADPDVRALADKGKNELASYLRRQHSSSMAFLAGIVASIVLVLAIIGGVILHQKYQANKAIQAALAAKLTADANQAALNLQQERDQEKQHEEAVARAQELHVKATNLANSMGADVSYKAAILVENRAGTDMADKVSVLEDKLNSSLAGKGFSIMSRAAVARAETALSNAGAQSETVDTASRQLGAVAQDIGADFIIYVSITSFGNEKKSYTGNGVATDDYIYTLRAAYRLIESGESGAITGATVVASKTIRQSSSLQTDSTELINQLLDDAAGQVVAAIRKTKSNPPAGGN
jgi:hypothetical protein